MVTAPLMIVVYDRIFVFNTWKETWRRRWQFYVPLAATWMVLAALIWSGPRFRSAGFSSGVSPWIYLLNQAQMIVRYLRLTIWPRGLVVDYGVPRALTLADAAPYAAVVLILAGADGLGARAPARNSDSSASGSSRRSRRRRASCRSPRKWARSGGCTLPLAAVVVLGGHRSRVGAGAIRPPPEPESERDAGDAPRACRGAGRARRRGGRARGRNGAAESRVRVGHVPGAHDSGALADAPRADIVGCRARRRGPARRGHHRAAKGPGRRSRTRTTRSASRCFRQGKLDEAVMHLREFLARESLRIEVPAAHELIGRALKTQGKYAEAEQEFRQVLTMTPSNGDVHGLLAETLVAAAEVRRGGRPISAVPRLPSERHQRA